MISTKHPALGADVASPIWELHILRPGTACDWQCIGVMSDRPTAEQQLNAFRRLMPQFQFVITCRDPGGGFSMITNDQTQLQHQLCDRLLSN